MLVFVILLKLSKLASKKYFLFWRISTEKSFQNAKNTSLYRWTNFGLLWGKRNIKTAQKLRKRLREFGIVYDEICTDNWEAFSSFFQEDTHKIGKKYTTNIEGNNTLLRHRIRRAVRRTYYFSKKFENHIKAFEIVFFYINLGWI